MGSKTYFDARTASPGPSEPRTARLFHAYASARAPFGTGKIRKFLERTVGLGLILLLGLLPGGCLVDNDKYDEAKRQMDQINGELQELHLANDHLNQEIARVYGEYDMLTTQLALLAAMNVHDRFTAGLSRPPAAQPATPQATGAATGRQQPPSTATPPRTPRVTPQTPPRSTGGTRSGETGGQRGGQRGGQTGGQRGGQTPPPPPPSSPGGGAIDWGTR